MKYCFGVQYANELCSSAGADVVLQCVRSIVCVLFVECEVHSLANATYCHCAVLSSFYCHFLCQLRQAACAESVLSRDAASNALVSILNRIDYMYAFVNSNETFNYGCIC